MNDTNELDRIINDGKVNSSTAMVIFAVELKAQGNNIQKLEQAITEDNKRYVPMKDYENLEKRVSRLENAALKVLLTVFGIVSLAVVTTVIRQRVQ